MQNTADRERKFRIRALRSVMRGVLILITVVLTSGCAGPRAFVLS